MQTRQTITIVTSPPVNTRSLPPLGGLASPTATKAPVYRVEERSRTIYVSSDVDPSQWDTHSLNTMFTLTETPESGLDVFAEQPIRRTKSHVDNQYIITEDVPDRSEELRVTSPRVSVYRSRRPGVKSANASLCPPPPDNPRRSSPVKASSSRSRILFYHKYDPHYGFTNFSPHPVIYNGKKYPTSEHLFQSFKVKCFRNFLQLNLSKFFYHISFSSIGQILQSTFEHVLSGPVLPFLRLVDFSQKYDQIGNK